MKKIAVSVIVLYLLLGTTPLNISGTVTDDEKPSDISQSILYAYDNESLLLPEFVPGELIVGFKEDADVNLISSGERIGNTGLPSLDKLNKDYYVKSAERLIENDSISYLSNIYLLNFPEDADVQTLVKEYETNKYVDFAEPNYLGYQCLTVNDVEETRYATSKNTGPVFPNDPDFNKQWGLYNTGQTGGIPDVDIDAPEAWEIETGDDDVVIAVIDSGIDYWHPDLADNIWINSGEDLNGNGVVDPSDFNDVDDDHNGYVDDIRGWDFLMRDNDPRDCFGHGTHCAGIAAAVTDNNEGIAGVCWNCKIMPVRVFRWRIVPAFTTAEGVIYATDNGADIISISLGWIRFSWILHRVINYAYYNEVIIVAAAGNAGHYGFPILTYPGRDDMVIGSGAINHLGKRYYKSSWGPSLNIVAPGENVYSTLPTYHVLMNDFGLNQSYDNLSGTSMACPHVAGIAALVLSHNSSLKNYEVRDILQSTAKDLGSKEKDWYFGYGLVNAYRAVEESSNYQLQNNNSYEVELNQSSYSQQFTRN